jgi:hypothetical protein
MHFVAAHFQDKKLASQKAVAPSSSAQASIHHAANLCCAVFQHE